MHGKTALLGALAGLAAAQLPPRPEGVKVVKSRHHEDVTISFKEPGLCEMTPGVKSYAGHVHLPPGLLEDIKGEKQDYPLNTFFWFFEARHDPENAPLAIWLNGGPGSTSMLGLLQENGPCFIDEDSKTTIHNPWSWNNHVNMLYIDEPNQVGFSYDVATNATINLETGDTVPADFSKGIPETNATHRIGTMSSGNPRNTVNNTLQAAHALWHFAQTFFFEFPHYKPHDDRISVWAESYGGHYGPGFMEFFQHQNEKIRDGTIEDEHAHYMHLDTLGIVNGCIDSVIRQEASITFPYNNTYGLETISKAVYEEYARNFTRPGGCKEQLIKCQKTLKDADGATIAKHGASALSNLCDMDDWCKSPGETAFRNNNNARFDITHPKKDPFPPPHLHGWLAREEVLQAIGTPVNFSSSSSAVSNNFHNNLDEFRGGFLEAIGYLLDSGVKVHMMYGDRDFACNWVGGEGYSLAIPYSRKDDFAKAGYAPLITEDGLGGFTRQFGNFSFTRVLQAGHEVPSYQPAAAYEIFMRSLFNKDIPTGLLPVLDELSTVGPSDTWSFKNEVRPAPKPKCYVLEPYSCTEELWEKVKAGKATIRDYFVVEDEDEVLGDGEL